MNAAGPARVPVRVVVLCINRLTLGDPAELVTCRRCGQHAGLRVLVVGPHLVLVACDDWHPMTVPGLTPAEVDRWTGPDTQRWEIENGIVPDELEADHPGITALLDRIGDVVTAATPVGPAPEAEPLPSRQARRITDMRVGMLADDNPRRWPTEQHPDEVVLVPVTRRELGLLRRETGRPDSRTNPAGQITRMLGDDLARRADALAAAETDHIRHVVAEHSSAVTRLLHTPIRVRTPGDERIQPGDSTLWETGGAPPSTVQRSEPDTD